MPDNHAFFVRGDDGEEYGPADLAELREWVGENRIGLGTEVRLDTPGELWRVWQYYPELVALLAEVRVTGAIPGLAGLVPAPFGRRILAGVADLILSFILILPPLFVCFLLLPPDFMAQSSQYWQAVLNGQILTDPPPQPPLGFEMAIDGLRFGSLVLYYAGFHALHGRTPAKSVLHLRVVDLEGRKPAPMKAFIRALVYAISIMPLWGLPLLYVFLNPQRRTLHDIVAGTYVVER